MGSWYRLYHRLSGYTGNIPEVPEVVTDKAQAVLELLSAMLL